MAAIKRPRGTRDLGPEEMALRRRVEHRMRTTLTRYAFREVQTPTFEHLELFTAKSGEAIKQELYAFEDKAGRALALRPEITAAVMRYFHTELSVEPRPLKLWYFSNCFRYDRPQKGRYREFWQVGCEIIGSERPEAHAELVALTLDLMQDAGVQEIEVRIGHIAVLSGLLDAIGVPSDDEVRRPLLRAIDKWDEKGLEQGLQEAGVEPGMVQRFLQLGGDKGDDAQVLEQARQLLESGAGDAATAAMQGIEEARRTLRLVKMQHEHAPMRFDPMIARGLDYYTGLVFEVDAPRLGAEKQVAGGGGYDLSGVFDVEKVATSGFALGFDRLLVALEAENARPDQEQWLDVYLAPIGQEQLPPAMGLARRLREAGLRVEVDLMQRAPGKNLKAADAHKARWALLLGAKEHEAGTVTVKTLNTGEQEEVEQDALPAQLKRARDTLDE